VHLFWEDEEERQMEERMKYKVLTVVLLAVVTVGFVAGLLSYNRKMDEMLGKEIVQATAADFKFSDTKEDPTPPEEEGIPEEPQNQMEETEDVTVPSLLGLSENEAIAKLIELGLTAVREEAYDEETPEGKILSQDPLPQSSAEAGTIVRFTVSLGSEEVTEVEQIIVPNLIGYTKEAAEAELRELGFQVEYEYNPSEHYDEGYVYSQNYKVGAEVDLGTTVKIRISTGNE